MFGFCARTVGLLLSRYRILSFGEDMTQYHFQNKVLSLIADSALVFETIRRRCHFCGIVIEGKASYPFEFCSNFTFGRENDRCVLFLDVNFIERIGEILEQTLRNLLRVLTCDIVEVTRCLSRRWDIFVSFILACWSCLITAKKSQSFAKTEAGLWN